METPPNVNDEAAPSLGLGTSAGAKAQNSPYRVLARKYRPARFEDLIGQGAMVKTLSNAFGLNRIHQAYILTGVRGVGKTTTARILARAFNYELPRDGAEPPVTKPTIHMPKLGTHCQAIIDSHHVDVIEMDAASHTGIDDVREIIESARYKPVMARTKVFIIDEVHMLSKQAFNGLLKTLEEPPDHVKFLFATTEIEKVPVTVRSRCQRFDLHRVEADLLVNYLATICDKENVEVEAEALGLIARAAEGSVRDALSLLDQAIAHAASEPQGAITAEVLRAMLGLADRSRVIDLFEMLMRGEMAAALDILKDLYDCGADPAEVLASLAEFTHLVTRLKIVKEAAQDRSLTPEERTRGQKFAQTLPMPILSRAWQMLLKGLREVRESTHPLAAADMVLVRIGFAADLPTPDELLRKLQSKPEAARQDATAPTPSSAGPVSLAAPVSTAMPAPRESAPTPAMALNSFEDVVAFAGARRDIQMKLALERDVRLVRFEPGRIEIAVTPSGSPQLAPTLARRLLEWTGSRWMVAVSNAEGGPSLKEQKEAKAQASLSGIRAEPLVRSVLAAFPGAEIVAVRPAAAPVIESSDSGDEIAFNDTNSVEDEF
ncbi:MAG TPA: DNA polymerase III subunit gamma/tau [Methylocella sp.]|nr:DNA polymerase III subunit gamma/tau [Methylocella sp.]